jgi:hypothetical protein
VLVYCNYAQHRHLLKESAATVGLFEVPLPVVFYTDGQAISDYNLLLLFKMFIGSKRHFTLFFLGLTLAAH